MPHYHLRIILKLLQRHTRESACVTEKACIWAEGLCAGHFAQIQGGGGDMYKEWHLIWRHKHIRRSCCVEAFRVQLLIPLWPTEVHTPPDYMSGLVSPAKQVPSCRTGVPTVASYFSLHAIGWAEFGFQPVRFEMITEDRKRLLVNVSMHKCRSRDERMWLVPFLFVFWLIESVSDWKQSCPFRFHVRVFLCMHNPLCVFFFTTSIPSSTAFFLLAYLNTVSLKFSPVQGRNETASISDQAFLWVE